MGRKKKVVTAEVVTEDRIVDANATLPENEETNITNNASTTEVTLSSGSCDDENLAKMITGSPTIAGEPSTEDQQLKGVVEERLSGVSDPTDGEGEPEVEERTVKTIARSLEELSIESIRHFDLIPDFVTPTTAEHPIIIRTDEGNHCVDGWTQVEAARSEGKTSIVCEVDELDTHSDEELCLRKSGIRSLTRGGICIYPEMIRNTKDLLAMLLSSDEDLRIYGHGERRYGEGFVNNREEDVRHILAMRLGRDRDTVNFYLSHGEYLSSDALQLLIDRQAPKEFFVRIQSKKRIALKNLKGKVLSIGRITKAISKFMVEEFEKFLANRESGRNGQTPSPAPTETESGNPPETLEDSESTDDKGDGVDNDDYSDPAEDTENPAPEGTIEEPVTPEKIFRTYDGVSKRMAQDLSKGISIHEMKDRLRKELDVIMDLLNMIDSISGTGK